MPEKIPPKLFKYQSCTDYAINNLRNLCLWFSKPGNFNDPFDCDINFNIKGVNEKSIKALFDIAREWNLDKKAFDEQYLNEGQINEKFKQDAIDRAIQATNKVKKENWMHIGVACFSEANDNILMWSHYANNHEGFCLEFDTRYLPFKLKKTERLLKVIYSSLNTP